MPELPSRRTMIKALMGRDTFYDHKFYAAVVTTGIYCRCICAGRKPKPKNVQFYLQQADARDAGFRACKRCRPDDDARKVVTAKVLGETVHAIGKTPAAKELTLPVP